MGECRQQKHPACTIHEDGMFSSSSSRSSDGNSSLLDEGGSASQVPQASVELAGYGSVVWPVKMECDYLCGWIKKNGHIHKNLTKKGKPQRYSWERRRRRRSQSKSHYKCTCALVSCKGLTPKQRVWLSQGDHPWIMASRGQYAHDCEHTLICSPFISAYTSICYSNRAIFAMT